MVTWTYSELFFFSFVSSTLWPAFRFLSFTREPCKRGGKNLTNKIILGEKKKKRQIKLLGFQRLLTKNICWTSWIFLRPWETHPRISNFFPNHQVGLAGLSQLTAPSDSCSVLPFFFFFGNSLSACLFHRYICLLLFWGPGEKQRGGLWRRSVKTKPSL